MPVPLVRMHAEFANTSMGNLAFLPCDGEILQTFSWKTKAPSSLSPE